MKKNTLLTLLTMALTISWAQDAPFNCDYNAYLFQYNDVYAIDLASGSAYNVASDITEGNINAAAYNPADGFIWGSLSTPAKSIVRIGKDFQTTTYYIDGLPTSNRYIGGINTDGIYYLKGGGTTYYKVDLNPNSSNYTKHLATEELSQNPSIHDWAFNAVDGNLYTVEKKTNLLYRINPNNGEVVSLGEVPILSGLNYTFGAVYFDASGRFYVSSNQSGTIYVIQNVQDIEPGASIDSNLFAFGPSSSQNDGARCPTAPVPQEDCKNGVDDDGDGLVDCDDPSCSGVSSCPVIEPPTSSGNDGGLESNNRLSNLITKRNYNRLKTNMVFDKNKALKVTRDAFYMKGGKKSNLSIRDFIPKNEINEDYIVESSPTDLLGITNAVDVYSVDYITNENTVASILALKTENGVYEHTKYICDRLLGAELLSVSTIAIRDKQFIRSIIKNSDGSKEFVLSFSVKESDAKDTFEIESHWNLDKYESSKSFFNFQIWSNSIDDLLILAEKVVALFEVQRPISSYNLSKPPTVFVRKGAYRNGSLDLEIVNANGVENVKFDAGMRATETADFEYLSSEIPLDGYTSKIDLQTGKLFDVGFRIGADGETPDDLFMSDGPWGLDYVHENTQIDLFEIEQNEQLNDDESFSVERNAKVTANTASYLSLYRALTPRFKPVDLSDFTAIKFQGSGSGKATVTLVKSSISEWQEHFKAEVWLTGDVRSFQIATSEFKSTNNEELILDDVVSIVFTIEGDQEVESRKELQINNLAFSNQQALGVDDQDHVLNENVHILPNPMSESAIVQFASKMRGNAKLEVYNAMGVKVYSQMVNTNPGINKARFERGALPKGIYFCRIIDGITKMKASKLILN